MTSPLAYPLAWLSNPEHSLQNEASGCISDDDSCVLACSRMRTPARAGRASAERQRRQLSVRDLGVVASIGLYRYMSATQVEELHFSGHATALTGARACRRVLGRLTRTGVLWRLNRRVGGVRAGSASYVYALTTLGYRILDDVNAARGRRFEPSEEFLDHTLAIAQLAVDVHRLARTKPGVDLVAIDPEPNCWRRFTAGLEGPQVLKPDLSISLRVGEYEYRWFAEVDLATLGSPAIVRKCRLYQRYWQSGIEQERVGIFPRVLFIAPSLRRASLIERSIKNTRQLNRDLFAMTTSADALDVLVGDEL